MEIIIEKNKHGNARAWFRFYIGTNHHWKGLVSLIMKETHKKAAVPLLSDVLSLSCFSFLPSSESMQIAYGCRGHRKAKRFETEYQPECGAKHLSQNTINKSPLKRGTVGSISLLSHEKVYIPSTPLKRWFVLFALFWGMFVKILILMCTHSNNISTLVI